MTTQLDKVRQRAENDAKEHGYYLNPNPEFRDNLLQGLESNEARYGYPSCPCRLASGRFEFDRDIICPCDYRDPDCEEYGCCFCALYVRKDVIEGRTSIQPIPERRPARLQARAYGVLEETSSEETVKSPMTSEETPTTKMMMWYCRQCGYVCFREDPPYICPICKAKKEMFTEITMRTEMETKI